LGCNISAPPFEVIAPFARVSASAVMVMAR